MNHPLIGDPRLEIVKKYDMLPAEAGDTCVGLLDSVQLTAQKQLTTPANWQPGDDVIIAPAVSDEEAKRRFPGGWKQPLPYIRLVRQPVDH